MSTAKRLAGFVLLEETVPQTRVCLGAIPLRINQPSAQPDFLGCVLVGGHIEHFTNGAVFCVMSGGRYAIFKPESVVVGGALSSRLIPRQLWHSLTPAATGLRWPRSTVKLRFFDNRHVGLFPLRYFPVLESSHPAKPL